MILTTTLREFLSSPAAQRVLSPVSAWVNTHRKGLSVTGLSLLAGYGITAFGIAPLAPDAADLPKRVLTQEVLGEAISPQLEALAGHNLRLTRSEQTRPTDSADSLLRRLGVADASATAFLRSDPLARKIVEGKAGKMVSAELDDGGHLLSLVARFPAPEAEGPGRFSRLRLEREGGRWQAKLELGALEASLRLASGTIRSTFFAATDEAGMPDSVASQMVEMFASEVDFHRELRPGDSFSLLYESLNADGEPISWSQGTGRVLAAELINKGKSYQTVWFGEGKGGYFDENGQSRRRSFLASPMAFSRITSGFAMRFHPIFQQWKAHLGVDYAAPVGTAVRTVGSGTVEFAGRQNGYGNVVHVRHAGDKLTVYAHLSRLDVKRGQAVEQGQRVGSVGATGWATGPHLHFEFRVNGHHKDPRIIARNAEPMKLEAAQKPRFQQLVAQYRAQLEATENLSGLAGRFE